MIHTVLIANRGEIASRVMRTCREMGIRTIAVFSDADAQLPYVKEADLAVHIGSSEPSESYLDGDNIINIARKYGANAIHPGYGFLAENYHFAKECSDNGIIFIGPTAEIIQLMGSKSEARQLMIEAKVPVVPGYHGTNQDQDFLKHQASIIGYPVLIKSALGGGGKGMKIVEDAAVFNSALDSAKREAQAAFGNNEMIIEKYISNGRHIEFQIFGDQHGSLMHLFERECTIQRRYQKIIEESPSPVLDDELRSRMAAAALRAAGVLNYDNAGTVEFILDEDTGDFYFLEINTRLQVEHAVTEELLGIDLVEMQIKTAQGDHLDLVEETLNPNGYAIELRLYAENTNNNFRPSAGQVVRFSLPEIRDLRVEKTIESGSNISIYYDPMIAKLIVKSADRGSALRKMSYVLRHLVCHGVDTNQELLLTILQSNDFQNGNYTTNFVHQIQEQESNRNIETCLPLFLIAAAMYRWIERNSERALLKALPSGWRNNFYRPQTDIFKHLNSEFQVSYRFDSNKFDIEISDFKYQITDLEYKDKNLLFRFEHVLHTFIITEVKESLYTVQHESLGKYDLLYISPFQLLDALDSENSYAAPMPSKIVDVLVKVGQSVTKGQKMMVLSSMKMENTILANEDGVVAAIYASTSENVDAGTILLRLK